MDLTTIRKLMETVDRNETIQFADNRISRYVAQGGKCYVTGKILQDGEIYCHHKKEGKKKDDSYENLVIVHKDIHRLIHAKNRGDIKNYFIKYGKYINLGKLNRLRKAINNFEIKENVLDNSNAK